MKFTGERYIPAEQGKIRLEHYHRYAMALDVVKEKEILDVACGEGYGSSFMADVARSVVGVDISVDAVRHATATYAKPNLTFCQGSATALDFADASFDVVVSFETIEHLAEQEQMLAEIRRVLRPDGLLVISSPNRPIYSEESGEHNEFHVKELDFKEFDELLKTQFQSIQYFGQRILMGSVIQPLEGGQGSFRAWHDDGNGLKPIAGHLAEPVYFVAVCGASSVDLPGLDMSVLYPDKLDLLKHYVGFAKWAQTQDRIVAERDGLVANLSQAVTERDERIASQNQSITELQAQIADLNQVVTKWDRRIASLDQRVAERDRRIATLDQGVAERDRRIASLDQRAAERDRRIASLNQSVTELDGEIGGLNDTVSTQDDKIIPNANLIRRGRIFYRSLTERLAPSNRKKRIIAEQTELIDSSNLFNSAWYLEQNPDVAEAEINPLAHYLSNGAVECRNPNPLFDNCWYLEQNPDVAEAGINPLVHYLSNGAAEVRDPGPLFDSRWYLEQNPDIAEAGINPLVHYWNNGAVEGRNPNPLFDGRWYLEQNPDVAEAGLNPLAHYLSKGAVEGLNPNPLFDSRWYLEQNPDVAEAGLNPLAHYLRKGAAEGRNPNSWFDSRWYLEQNPDVAVAGTNPLVHFILSGAEEGRQPKPQPFRDMKILCEHLLRINRKQFGLLGFESFDTPKVSIIIPVYNQVHYTIQCLESICRYLPLSSFEIIVVDDCSSDDTTKRLSSIEGVKVVSNETNQGFVRSCNIGAKAARGEYLHFLNNDTEVTAGWLDELVRTFHEFPGTGFVGSKLVYPDGSLQEAGGIIWQDGSAWNFGRFQDPQLPLYNYAREVDYCSGASIMVPKLLFDELGGFDEHYLPAYCEDCDLALKIRDLNYRVIYQPLSEVIHYEGVTSGTDLTKGVKAYQVENTAKLFVRWQERFRAHQAPGVEVDQAKDRMAKRRVLVLDYCTPTPNQDAGSIVTFNMLLLLREMGFQVTFIPEHNLLYLPDYTPALQRAGIEVLYAPYLTSVEQHLNELGKRYDLALLFRGEVLENNVKLVRRYCPHAKVLFHTVDLHFLRMTREAALLSDSVKMLEAKQMKQRELAAICLADASIVVSMAELELLRPELPNGQIHVLPLIMNVEGTRKTFFDRRNIIFVGGYQHTPNVDAVQYFVAEIMPLLRTRLPGVCFYVVGSNPPVEILALACEDVIVLGFVDDLNPLLDKMRISVAPLRFGAGIKGKIGSAMSVGLPVVATPLAAEGMSLTTDENILVADGAEAFADTIAKLYKDEALWNRISHNGLEFTENAWGAEAAWKILNEILSEMSISTTRGAYPLSLCSGSEPAQKEIKKRADELTAITSVKSRENFILALDNELLKQIREIEKTLLESSTNEAFAVDGYCVPCRKKVSFLVDMQSGGQRQDDGWLPNWRERLECPVCRMNNRQRLIATLIEQELDVDDKKSVYFMEQVTPIYNWATAAFKKHNIVGSEYLGHEYEGGAIIKGIRHEDVENLSFPDGALDLIVSNDVFEHVPNPARAFAECVRVLKTGGVLLATIPFHSNNDLSIARAKLVAGALEHILPPSYHGNPVSADGSLVFTDFGWDVLEEMQEAGFSDVSIEVYASVEFGHLGGGQLVFRLTK
ncbi:MAG: methyltransferase domain-containing protein [Methylobacter sp.]|uniref:methyltransferase domain-containing protein n=1 Tax=Methylobacter sp. TaxID=2051955 RepID=UPI0027313D74|nr:methyltransferase domain-containing protein [Methylobacter sp.]MDP1665896.1 methyltransferase domain-containing protein [Methylobacter sp.]